VKVSHSTLALMIAMVFTMSAELNVNLDHGQVVWNADNPMGLKWGIVNDTVMGGVSSSRFDIESGVGVFSGELSLENNGGFASMRTKPKDLKLSDQIRKFMVRVKGDGRKYKLAVRRHGSFDGVNYQLEFKTVAGEWVEVDLPLARFKPSWRGRPVDDPELVAADVRSVGVMIADKIAGEFKLEIDWIKISG
jgi:monofunctional biosynthetic peptidoglycan transglycosylase